MKKLVLALLVICIGVFLNSCVTMQGQMKSNGYYGNYTDFIISKNSGTDVQCLKEAVYVWDGWVWFYVSKITQDGRIKYGLMVEYWGPDHSAIQLKDREPLIIVLNDKDKIELKMISSPTFIAHDGHPDFSRESAKYEISADIIKKMGEAKNGYYEIHGNNRIFKENFNSDSFYNFNKFYQDTIILDEQNYYVKETGDKFEGKKIYTMNCRIKSEGEINSDSKKFSDIYFDLIKTIEKGSTNYTLSFSIFYPAKVDINSGKPMIESLKIQKGETLIALLDDNEKLTLISKSTPKQELVGSSIQETIEYDITAEQINKFSKANTIDVRIKGKEGNIDGAVEDISLKNIKKFYNEYIIGKK